MVINSRTQSILKLLLDADTYISVHDIAREAELSERTIYNELLEIKRILKDYKIILETASKQGICLKGNNEDLLNLKKIVEENRSSFEWNVKDRINMLILILLSQNEPIKATAIAIILDVSVPTVRNDLNDVEEILNEQNLALLRKKGEGFFIEGDRWKKGHYAVSIFISYINCDTFYGIFQKRKNYSYLFITSILKEYGYIDILNKIRSSIGDIIISNFGEMSDVKFEELIIMFMMFIKNHESHDQFIDIEIDQYVSEWDKKMAKLINDALQLEFSYTFCTKELNYITWLISINNKNGFDNYNGESRWIIVNKVKELLLLFEKRMKITLSVDVDFANMLVAHINGAIAREKSGIICMNPLRENVEKKYKKLIETLEYCVKKVFPNHNFSLDELSYLTLYFAVMVEKSAKRTVEVLVVCTSGMGSSKMLESRLEREIPEINVVKTVPLIQLSQENLDYYDFVLSTVPIELEKNQYMIVSPLLTEKEVTKIKDVIKQKKNSEIPQKGKFYSTFFTKEMESDGKSKCRLEDMGKRIKFGIDFIDRFCVISTDELEFEKDKIGRYLINFGVIEEDVNIPSDIIQIPRTQLGYLEIECDNCVEPSFVMVLKDNDDYSSHVKAVIVLIYNNKMDEFILDMLSTIIETISDNMRILLNHMDYEAVMKSILEKGIIKYLSNNFLKEV